MGWRTAPPPPRGVSNGAALSTEPVVVCHSDQKGRTSEAARPTPSVHVRAGENRQDRASTDEWETLIKTERFVPIVAPSGQTTSSCARACRRRLHRVRNSLARLFRETLAPLLPCDRQGQ